MKNTPVHIIILTIVIIGMSLVGFRSVAQNVQSVPVMATAHDLVTKVYGILSPEIDRDSAVAEVEDILHVKPLGDDNEVWVEDCGGYMIDYYGMKPATSALAVFDGNRLSDYGYMFEFPYGCDNRECVLKEQADFCGALLQELYDIGAVLFNDDTADSFSSELFRVFGNYDGCALVINLRELAQTEGEDHSDSDISEAGCFLLLMTVTPPHHDNLVCEK